MQMKPLIDAGTIAKRVAELGRAITHDYLGKDLVIVPVLKGSYVFAADLVRHIDLDVAIDFLGVRSYGDQQESSGVVQITDVNFDRLAEVGMNMAIGVALVVAVLFITLGVRAALIVAAVLPIVSLAGSAEINKTGRLSAYA